MLNISFFRKDYAVFHPNENQQISIKDSFNQPPENLKDYLRKTWALEFQDIIFHAIN